MVENLETGSGGELKSDTDRRDSYSPDIDSTIDGHQDANRSSLSHSSAESESSEQQTATVEFSSINSSYDDIPTNEVTATADASDSNTFKRNLATTIELGGQQQLSFKNSRKNNYSQNIIDGGFSISWANLNYVVESKWYKLSSQRKPILNNINGTFKSGELSAVLGPSGAGKSTLIDCLMGKRDRGICGKTKVTFNDKAYELERRKRRPLKIVTIPQDDHLLDTLTVMETLMFASKIKNAHLIYEDEEEANLINGVKLNKMNKTKHSENSKPFNHFNNVQRVLQQLNLSSCANMRCGKLSGGQYKRVSIGQELLSRPDLMILDEPTSGLDSVTCFQTIKALRQLIETSPYPMAIVATIHQPDIEAFNLFHKAYVLASGGTPIYEGPTDGIFDTVQLALNLVETRKKNPIWAQVSNFNEGEHLISNLQEQLAERNSNPARLIVQLASNEYGFEITKALNELQWNQPNQVSPYSSKSDITTYSKDKNQVTLSQSPSTSKLVESAEPEAHVNISEFNRNVQLKSAPHFDYLANDPSSRKADLDKLLNLVSANVNQRTSIRVYFKHFLYHTHRSWITILRDPMLFTVQLFLHIFVPLLISYAFQGQRADACPRIGPLDVIDEAYRTSGNLLSDLNTELRIVFENLGYMFFQLYVIIFAAVCVTSLTYPLVMHVLLKEYRNGWYSLSSYFLGRTVADLPIPAVNVFLAIAISYHLTGQPLSPYGWRFLSVSMLTLLAVLIAQTQGLMFGAMLMNLPQSAVFVAPASTAPLVVVSGFLIRIRSLPFVLQILSQLSYFTHLLNGFIISRYGFNRCPCKEEDFLIDEERRIPGQARSIINIWADTFQLEYFNYTQINNTYQVDLVGKLEENINLAKTFGYEMTNCSQVKPFPMLDFGLDDSHLIICFSALGLMLIIFRWLTYIVLSWKISSSI